MNYEVLLKEMSFQGFSSLSIKWFKLYLSKRTFNANIENKHSSIAKIDCGVPQES